MTKQRNGLAEAALITGLVGFVSFGLTSVVAIVLGIMGSRRSESMRGAGKGAARWGLWLGVAGLAINVLLLAGAFLWIVGSTTSATRETPVAEADPTPTPSRDSLIGRKIEAVWQSTPSNVQLEICGTYQYVIDPRSNAGGVEGYATDVDSWARENFAPGFPEQRQGTRRYWQGLLERECVGVEPLLPEWRDSW